MKTSTCFGSAASVVVLAGTILCLVLGCDRSERDAAKSAKTVSEKVLVKVNGSPVYEGDVLRRIRAAHGDVDEEAAGPNRWHALLEAAVEAEILEKLLLRAARSEGMEVSDEEVDAAFARTREMMGEETFREMIVERGASEDEFREFLRERELVEQYKRKLHAGIEVDDETLREYFDGHSEGFVEPESVRLEAFAVASQEQAEEIHRQWSAGKDFGALSEEFSESAEEKIGRRTRWMPLDAVPIELQEQVGRAEVGDLLDPVEVSEKYYVVKVIERRGAGTQNFEATKEQIREVIRVRREQKILSDWYERAIKEAHIEYVR